MEMSVDLNSKNEINFVVNEIDQVFHSKDPLFDDLNKRHLAVHEIYQVSA